MHAGRQGLLDHPGIGAQCIGGAGNRQGDDHRRRLVAGAGRTRVDQPAHELAQLLEVERAVLHFIGDVVGLGRRHLLALVVAATADLRVVDGLALQPQVDDAVDVLAGTGGLFRHVRRHRIHGRRRLLGAGRHRGQQGDGSSGQPGGGGRHGMLPVSCGFGRGPSRNLPHIATPHHRRPMAGRANPRVDFAVAAA